MALIDDIRLFSQLPLFADMGDEHLRLVAFGADRRNIQAGQTLFRQHSPAESAYIVVSGSFELTVTDRDGAQKVETIVKPGTMLSELALVTLVERKFTAIAQEDSIVIRITRTLFHRLIEEYPDAAQLIERRVRDNFAQMAQQAAAIMPRFS